MSVIFLLVVATLTSPQPAAQTGAGSIRGTVSLAQNNDPVHGATVLVTELRRTVATDETGQYEITNVPPGIYTVLAQREHLTTERQQVTVPEGQAVTANFSLALSGIHEEITVTANPTGEATTFEAFNAISTLDSVELTQNRGATLADAVESLPGLSKRTFGPGSARPIIRGFDGDRVLIMQDGVRTGDLSSQSGDHGVSIDPAGLQRVEIVKGPATLLYGSNAIGGVVNAISPQETFRSNPFNGVLGQVGFDAGSANTQAGGAGSVQVGHGPWLVWAGGSARRTGDYDTPEGTIENSATRLVNGSGGFGWNGGRGFFSLGAQADDSRYGIPFAGQFEAAEASIPLDEAADVDISMTRQDYRFDAGVRNLDGAIRGFRASLNYLNYQHTELEVEDGQDIPATVFDNQTFVYRAEAEQAVRGRLSGRFGIWGQARDYVSTGAEALAPPTTQDAIAAFAYEELNFGRWRLQIGGRFEHNSYKPDPRPEAEGEETPPEVRDRSFTGFSGSAGVHTDIGTNGAFIVNLTRSARAPALEELFNFGPHIGNLAFEIGNPDLEMESSIGVDVALRRRTGRVHGEVSAFVYSIANFVFLDFTGEIVDGLREAPFLQADSRFFGFDGDAGFELGGGSHLNVGLGYVRATLTDTDEALPRIPAFHGSVDLEVPWRQITFRPELVWMADQDRVFREETPTAGSAVFNIGATWLASTGHMTHVVAVKAYNLFDTTYRLHTSLIKDLAPEMGRGIRVAYSVRFF
ncbi:MAG: TonB-dependent receptor [Vicinamibacterales bacterium]